MMLRIAAKAVEEELTRQSASLLSLNQTTALIRGDLVTTEEILPEPLPEDVTILDRIRQGVYDSYIVVDEGARPLVGRALIC